MSLKWHTDLEEESHGTGSKSHNLRAVDDSGTSGDSVGVAGVGHGGCLGLVISNGGDGGSSGGGCLGLVVGNGGDAS